MNTRLTSAVEKVHSTTAISAHAKENIRMQAQRYQRGSLSLLKRKSQPDTWVFRYYVDEGSATFTSRFTSPSAVAASCLSRASACASVMPVG